MRRQMEEYILREIVERWTCSNINTETYRGNMRWKSAMNYTETAMRSASPTMIQIDME